MTTLLSLSDEILSAILLCADNATRLAALRTCSRLRNLVLSPALWQSTLSPPRPNGSYREVLPLRESLALVSATVFHATLTGADVALRLGVSAYDVDGDFGLIGAARAQGLLSDAAMAAFGGIIEILDTQVEEEEHVTDLEGVIAALAGPATTVFALQVETPWRFGRPLDMLKHMPNLRTLTLDEWNLSATSVFDLVLNRGLTTLNLRRITTSNALNELNKPRDYDNDGDEAPDVYARRTSFAGVSEANRFSHATHANLHQQPSTLVELFIEGRGAPGLDVLLNGDLPNRWPALCRLECADAILMPAAYAEGHLFDHWNRVAPNLESLLVACGDMSRGLRLAHVNLRHLRVIDESPLDRPAFNMVSEGGQLPKLESLEILWDQHRRVPSDQPSDLDDDEDYDQQRRARARLMPQHAPPSYDWLASVFRAIPSLKRVSVNGREADHARTVFAEYALPSGLAMGMNPADAIVRHENAAGADVHLKITKRYHGSYTLEYTLFKEGSGESTPVWRDAHRLHHFVEPDM